MYLGRLARLRPVRLLVQNSRFWFKTDSWCKARLTTTAIPAGQRVRAGVEQPQPFLLPLFAEARRREILVKFACKILHRSSARAARIAPQAPPCPGPTGLHVVVPDKDTGAWISRRVLSVSYVQTP